MIALLVMTDGRRDCIARTIPSFLTAVDRPDHLTELWIHDDSGDPDYHLWLIDRFGPTGFRVITGGGRSGFGGAIRSAWAHLREHTHAPLIFHLEDDFEFSRTIPLTDMARVLRLHPHLAQMALRRQPWNATERAAGGIVECHPEDYADAQHDEWSGPLGRAPLQWLEHRRFFTTNPCLYRTSLISEHEWPDGPNSEGRFGIDLFASGHYRAGYWGGRYSGEWCEHIGVERVGIGY